MLQNFTLIDIVGSVEASLLLTLILFVPGYVIGWLSHAFSFRQQRFLIQSLISTPLAVAVLPIVVYFLGRYRTILWLIFAGIWVAFVLIIRPKLADRWWTDASFARAAKWGSQYGPHLWRFSPTSEIGGGEQAMTLAHSNFGEAA